MCDVFVVLRLAPDEFQLGGSRVKAMSPILAVPLRTRTSHFTTVAIPIPVVFAGVLLGGGLPQALLRGKLPRQGTGARGLRSGGQIAAGLGEISGVFQHELLGGRAAAAHQVADGRGAGAGGHLADRFADGHFFEFDRLDAGG